MKIGVMLRDIANQKDAPGIIVLNLMDKILEIDKHNEYVLFYRNRIFFDRYATYPNAKAICVPAPSKLLWDQLAIPWAARRENVDLLFHPKHSIPLLTRRKTLMHLRGADCWTFPEFFESADGFYLRFFLPLFCRKATHIIVESLSVKKEFQDYMSIPDEKVSLVYLAPSPRFEVISDRSVLEDYLKKYSLPDRFILTVTRVLQGQKFYPGKNILNSLEAFRRSEARQKMKFVIIGRKTKDFIDKILDASDDLRNDLIILEFVPQEELAVLYNLAEIFLFPSTYESFGIPILEAMACGCPVITSNTFACSEVAGESALLVDPKDVDQIAISVDRLAFNKQLQNRLTKKGLDRTKEFSWKKAALETISIFEQITT